MDELKKSVIQFCTEIGSNPLLVQGAGGNVSWKDGGTLWVKASGTWLSDAVTSNIFVPVDLNALQKAINVGDFSAKPTLISESELKPSIETLLHALMPHRIVVHLHAIEVLAYLVRRNCESELDSLLKDEIPSVIVDYFKPGAELAAAIKEALEGNREAKAIFLKNHGIVVGGADIEEIQLTLSLIFGLLRTRIDESSCPQTPTLLVETHLNIESYAPIDDRPLHELAVKPQFFARLTKDWALYPDHVVFLGPYAHMYNSFSEFKNAISSAENLPELVFICGQGVFVTKSFNKTKAVQLHCYYDVLVRQPQDAELSALSSDDISDLLARDDEKHRIRHSK